MKKVLDIFLVICLSLLMTVLSIGMIIVPFFDLKNFLYFNLDNILININRNYIISLVGVVLLVVCLRILYSVFSKKNRHEKNRGKYIVNTNSLGEVNISIDTLIGIGNNTLKKFNSLENTSIGIGYEDSLVSVEVRGEITRETDIQQVTRDIQESIKKDIEAYTDIEVREVQIYITNIYQPSKGLK